MGKKQRILTPSADGNYLALCPVRMPSSTWTERWDLVTIHVPRRGAWNRLAQRLWAAPPVSHIQLDRYGSFLWPRMDGQRTVGQLGQALGERFGQEAEPLYGRLVLYVEGLRRRGLIRLREMIGEERET